MDFDRDHLWHPYSSMTRPSAPYLTESASGTRFRLRVDGEPPDDLATITAGIVSAVKQVHG